MTLGWVACLALAAMLAFAGVAKLVAVPATSQAIGGMLGVSSPQLATAMTLVLACGELLLSAALVAQLPSAAPAAAIALSAFAAVQIRILATRGSGVRCGCFGPRSQITPASLARSAVWVVAAWALAVANPPPVDARLMGWSVAAVALGALAAAVGVALELARRVVMLTEERGPEGALEIDGEGPPLGAVLELGENPSAAPLGALPAAFGEAAESSEPMRLAVFVSPACGLCRSLRPAIETFARRPGLAVTIFDEERDAGAWRVAHVPGSPYAVAMDASATVLAKGAFNSMRQLESVCATAQRRATADRERDAQAA